MSEHQLAFPGRLTLAPLASPSIGSGHSNSYPFLSFACADKDSLEDTCWAGCAKRVPLSHNRRRTYSRPQIRVECAEIVREGALGESSNVKTSVPFVQHSLICACAFAFLRREERGERIAAPGPTQSAIVCIQDRWDINALPRSRPLCLRAVYCRVRVLEQAWAPSSSSVPASRTLLRRLVDRNRTHHLRQVISCVSSLVIYLSHWRSQCCML